MFSEISSWFHTKSLIFNDFKTLKPFVNLPNKFSKTFFPKTLLLYGALLQIVTPCISPTKVKSPQILLLIYFPLHVTELPWRKPLRFSPENNFRICPRENIFLKDRHFNACLLLNNTETLSTWMFCISFIRSPFPTTILKLCTHKRKL